MSAPKEKDIHDGSSGIFDERLDSSKQLALCVLYDLATSPDTDSAYCRLPLNVKKQLPVVLLARRLLDLVDEGTVLVDENGQKDMFSVCRIDNGCFESGVLLVGRSFQRELEYFPDSAVAGLLLELTRALVASGNITKIGDLSMGKAEEVIAGFLRTFPEGVPMTAQQKELLNAHSD